MLVSNMITEGLPEDWCVMLEWEWSGAEAEPYYQAYRWGRKEIRSGLFRRKQIKIGWHPVGTGNRFSDVVVDFVHRMDREMKRGGEQSA